VTDKTGVSSELSRDLTLFHIVMMGLGMMIGAGVFVGIGLSIQMVGPGGVLLTFVLNGLIALFTAMSFAELSSAIPRAGGAYNFARVGFGRGASFIAGWMEWFASSLAGAFYAIVLATFTLKYLNQVLALGLTDFQEAVWVKVVAVAAAGFFIYINYRGSSETGKIGAIFTIGQMLFVVGIGVVGVVVAVRDPSRLANFRPFMPYGWARLLGAMGLIYVAFEGFEVIAQAGDETIDPKHNVPKAMLYSVLIVTITYAMVAFATVVAIRIDSPELAGKGPIESFRTAVQHLIPAGGLLLTMAVVFSATSALNATIYSATRASYALGRDRMLPGVFAKISPKRKTPYGALAMTSCIVLAAAMALNPKDGAATASIMFLFLFFVVNVCVIRVRRQMGDELEYGYIMPLFPLFPILAIICQIALAGGILHESRAAWIIAIVWVPAGAVIYMLYSRTRVTVGEHEISVLEEDVAPVGDGYRIMVAVANPTNALEMVRTTYKLCGAKDARVELLHMVPVPPQVKLADASRYMVEGKEGILETMLYLAPLFPISTTLRYCRSIARGIISAVREKRIDMLILGWHGRMKGSLFSLGSTLDPVIERSPCDVVIMKDCGHNRKFTRVLVPVAGGPNAALALEIAGILADEEDATITAFTVADPKRPFDLDAFILANRDRIRDPRRVQPKVVEARNVVSAILEEAGGHDLIVLGCTGRGLLYQFARTSVPEMVARKAETPLIMVKARGRFRSWLRRHARNGLTNHEKKLPPA